MGGVPLMQGRQKVNSGVKEDVKCKGGKFQCAIPPSRIEGVKRKQHKTTSTQRFMVQDINKGME